MSRLLDLNFRAGTAAAWTTANPVLHAGEPGWETDTFRMKVGDGATAWTALPYVGASTSINGIYGIGGDGSPTIAGTTTLARDMYYDTLTVSATGILKTNGFRVFCKTLLTIASGGIVQADGASGVGAAAGASWGTTSLNSGNGAGGAGGTAAGSAGTGQNNAIGGRGASGGLGASGAGGTSPALGSISNSSGGLSGFPQAILVQLHGVAGLATVGSGGGGGGGGGDTTNSGGGGGAGGGLMVINAKQVINNGIIRATGGNGAASSAGNTGGGGGGGGGAIVMNTAVALTGNTPTVLGGSGGAKTGTGVAGSAGSAGTVTQNVWT